MKISSTLLCLSLAAAGSVAAFSPSSPKGNANVNSKNYNANPYDSHLFSAVTDAKASENSSSGSGTQDPLLIRAAKGETTERVPVWMMRQAGRHMKVYRDLCKKHTTFRQRSEIPEVAVEISLLPYQEYKTDGCILFSDILTPFLGMGMDFTIDEKLGPVMPTIRSWEELKNVRFFFCVPVWVWGGYMAFGFCVLSCLLHILSIVPSMLNWLSPFFFSSCLSTY